MTVTNRFLLFVEQLSSNLIQPRPTPRFYSNPTPLKEAKVCQLKRAISMERTTRICINQPTHSVRNPKRRRKQWLEEIIPEEVIYD